MTNPTLDAALAYARKGWRVLPVVAGGKIPATQHGVHDATTDEDRIRAWFGSESGSKLNIGIAAGKESGLIVFDIDPRNGGSESWQMWQDYHGSPPEGPMAFTAGGGQHYLAAYQEGVRSTKLADGIDLLSDGRYFVAYPSVIEGRQYLWESSLPAIELDGVEAARPFALPESWVESCVQARTESKQALASSGLIQGNRNAGLTALAGAMRHHGMTEAEILAALSVANETRCESPLPVSEIRAIAASVSRYQPDGDVAASVAHGTEVAEAILAAEAASRSDYYLTRATSFLQQPSPIDWLVRGWVPLSGTSMVYGESAAGKTFLTLDIACSVASESVNWCGLRTSHGVAVYLAGEGNYGLRQRVAAWAKKHNVTNLDRLLVSNRALDLDNTDAVQSVLRAVNEMADDQKVSLVIVDTVNNHMAGDENSAKDVRALFGAVNTVAAALGCPVILNHHLGHGQEAQRRARGSSAFKASLDSSILVENRDGTITVTCTKMKDGPMPEPLFGQIETVDLGWMDGDGQAIAGAVWSQTEAPPDTREQDRAERREDRAQAKLERWRSLFERAWFNADAELVTVDGQERPYLSRSALRDFLISTQRSMTTNTVEQHLKPSAREGSMVRDLTDTAYLEPYQDGRGWVVTDHEHATALLLSRDARRAP